MELVYFEAYAWCKVYIISDLIRPIIDLFPRLYDDDARKIQLHVQKLCNERLVLLHEELTKFYYVYSYFEADVHRKIKMHRINNKIEICLKIYFSTNLKTINSMLSPNYPIYNLLSHIEDIYSNNEYIELILIHEI